MSSAPFLVPPFAAPPPPAARLAQETGALAARLADLMDHALSDAVESGGARAFLRGMAAAGEGDGAGHPWSGEDSPLDRVVRGFSLSPVEADLLLLAALPEEHEGYAGILRTLHPRGEPRATTGLAAQLFCTAPEERAMLRATLEAGTAGRAGLFRTADDAPFWERSLYPADALWSALHGIDAWPAGLLPDASPAAHAGLDAWLAGPAASAVAAVESGAAWTVLVTADSDEAAHARAAALVAAAGAAPLRVTWGAAPAAEAERHLSVHAVARGLVPVLRVPPAEGPGGADAPELAHHPGPFVVCGRPGTLRLRGPRPVVEVSVDALGPAARAGMWHALAPELADDADDLAARYTVEPDAAAAALADARAVARLEARAPTADDVGRGVRTRAGLTLSGGIRLLRPTATWDDLVLRPDRLCQLREAIDRLHNQATVLDGWRLLHGRPGARGVRMLFAGPSGTGKTLASEVIASTLGVDLLLVDVSRVVSKWIGETEKNLSEVFDVAERAQAVLLFDEADALFGRRTEVSDAHDRYANLETAYLLMRLERFDGLAVLSTNLRQNIDGAFLRRLEFVVDFEEPGPAERASLWRCHIPPTAPLDPAVDFAELSSHFPVVGGFIRNAAVAAAFRAAADGSPITRNHLVHAVRREYDKTGRAFPGFPSGTSAH
jgi:hypothetical protein